MTLQSFFSHLRGRTLRLQLALSRTSIFLRAGGFFAAVVLGGYLYLFLLLDLARAGSHGALMVLDFTVFFVLPLVLLGWLALQGYLGYWLVRVLGWGFQRGSGVLLFANGAAFAAGLPTVFLLLGYFPGAIAETAARLGDAKVVGKWTREAGTLASATYPAGQPGEGFAIALPPGLLRVTVSFRPGTIRYGVRSGNSGFPIMAAATVRVSQEETACLQEASGFSSMSSALSTVALGTGHATFHQASAPFPRELLLVREAVASGERIKPIADLEYVRDVILSGEETPQGRPLTVTVTLESLQPSAQNVFLVWLLGMVGVPLLFYLHQKKKTTPTPTSGGLPHGNLPSAQ